MMLHGPQGKSSGKRRVVLGVTGSIAAYKAPVVLRLLLARGNEVDVVMTRSAGEFIGKATFEGLGARVFSDAFSGPGELHVELGKKADAILIAPATADTIARLAHGRADDLLTSTVLCSEARLFLAPAMHPKMWGHAATLGNASILSSRGAVFLGPVTGTVASGDVGEGRMEEPERIVSGLELSLQPGGTLRGRRIVVTAGPTRERIDPVRSLTNHSTGKMGFAIAEQAARQGALVTLISGPTGLETPPLVRRVDVESATDMLEALYDTMGTDLSEVDALVMAAAVSDFRPRQASNVKLKRDQGIPELDLIPNPDLLATLGRKRSSAKPLLVGFALETQSGEGLAGLGRRKLIEKRADLIVANYVDESLGRDDSKVMLVSARDCVALDFLPKTKVALHIVEWIGDRLNHPLEEHSA